MDLTHTLRHMNNCKTYMVSKCPIFLSLIKVLADCLLALKSGDNGDPKIVNSG